MNKKVVTTEYYNVVRGVLCFFIAANMLYLVLDASFFGDEHT